MGSSRTGLILEDTSRKKFGGLGLELVLALALNHHGLGLGLDAALLSLGVSVLVSGIYASVILTFAKIHLSSA
jgi:hypothetical protein